MKFIKKAWSALLIFTLCFNLISSISVFAGVKHDGYVLYEPMDSEVVTVNLNLKKNLENSYGLQINCPKNLADMNNMNNVYSRGFARFTADGGMKVKDDGGWMNDDKSGGNTLDMSFPADGQWYNLKIRVNSVTKKVEWYFEDELVFTSNFTHTDGEYATTSLIIFGDSTYEPNGLEWELVSAIGTNANEMSVSVSDINEEDKTITLDFSEPVASSGALSGLALKNTNTYGEEDDIPLTVESIDSSRVVFSYTGDLANRSEYAIILPEGLKGKFGNSLTNNILYFNTEYSSSEIATYECDYENFNSNVDITVLQTVPSNIKYFDDVNKNTFVIDKYKDGWSNNWLNWHAPSGTETFLSFDIIPLFNDLKYALEFSNAAINSTPIYIVFAETGDIVCGNAWPNDLWFDRTGMSGDWSKAGTSGKYTANEKINFKITFNDSANLVTVYMNDKEIKNFAGSIQDIDKLFGGIRFRGMSDTSSRPSGTELMLFDNIRSGYVQNAAGITSVKYYNTDGTEFGSFDTVEGIFDYAKVYFSASIDDATVDYGDAYITYNGEAVECTTEYDVVEKCLIVKPAKVPNSDDEIAVSVSGINDLGGNTLDAVTTLAKADEFESAFTIEKLGFTDSMGNPTETIGGNIFAEVKMVNTTDIDRTVIVTVLGYKDGALEKHNCKQIPVNAHTSIVLNEIDNPIGIDSYDLNSVTVILQDAKTGEPLYDGVSIINAE